MEETNGRIPETTPPEEPGGFGAQGDAADDWSDLEQPQEGEQKDPKPPAEEEGETSPQTPQDEETPPADLPGQEQEKPTEEQPLFDLKYQGQVRQVGREEVIALAQKGMDYEVIRGQWDAVQDQLQRLAGLEAFLQELAQPQNMTVEDLMDSTRAQVMAEREGLDPTVALQRVKLDRERREFQAAQDRANRTQQEQARQAAKRQDGFLRFAREYPQVDPKEIPKEVWDQFGQGADLTDAYARWENKKLRQDNQALQAKLETAEKNAKNKERSTGSQQSAGQAPMDELDRAWYDGT